MGVKRKSQCPFGHFCFLTHGMSYVFERCKRVGGVNDSLRLRLAVASFIALYFSSRRNECLTHYATLQFDWTFQGPMPLANRNDSNHSLRRYMAAQIPYFQAFSCITNFMNDGAFNALPDRFSVPSFGALLTFIDPHLFSRSNLCWQRGSDLRSNVWILRHIPTGKNWFAF